MFIVKNTRSGRYVTKGRANNGPLSTSMFIDNAKRYKSEGGALRSVGLRTRYITHTPIKWGVKTRRVSHHRCNMPVDYRILELPTPEVVRRRKVKQFV